MSNEAVKNTNRLSLVQRKGKHEKEKEEKAKRREKKQKEENGEKAGKKENEKKKKIPSLWRGAVIEQK